MIRRPEPVSLPPEARDRVNRVYAYHVDSGHTFESVRASSAHPDLRNRPSPYRVFADCPKAPLPTSLLDLPVSTQAVIDGGLEAVPESLRQPPQDLKTLATWLHMAGGVTSRGKASDGSASLRACPSSGALYPCEIYVAAFGIEGLEPGLYHYSVKEYALRRLRDGAETLLWMKRGRPDLEFLRHCPAALLVSTIYCRMAWKYGARGYRYALLDAGHLVGNLVITGQGLGIQTIGRLRLSDSAMSQLIGVAPDAPFGEIESVHAVVAWADSAQHPLDVGGRTAPRSLAPIPRAALSAEVADCAEIAAAHRDCVAPGGVALEVRPPLSELMPLPPETPAMDLPAERVFAGSSLRQTLLARRSAHDFIQHPLTRDQFVELNRLSFRSGTFFPIKPDGPHVGIVRPFWIVNDVTGMESGTWYYHPPTDQWHLLRTGDQRFEAKYLSLEQGVCGNASAVCFLAANLHALMTQAGPDSYRLAHLEAGVAGQRMYLAAGSMGLGCCGIGAFYDEELRRFFTMEQSGWSILYALAVGMPVRGEGASGA